MRGAQNARPLIDNETQILSLEVICELILLKPIEIYVVNLMSKRKHLQALAQVRNYCIAKFCATATFVPNQIGDRNSERQGDIENPFGTPL